MNRIFVVITEDDAGGRSAYLIERTGDIQTQEDAANRVVQDEFRHDVIEVSHDITPPSEYPTPNQILSPARTVRGERTVKVGK